MKHRDELRQHIYVPEKIKFHICFLPDKDNYEEFVMCVVLKIFELPSNPREQCIENTCSVRNLNLMK